MPKYQNANKRHSLKHYWKLYQYLFFYKDINGKYVGCNTIFERFSGFKQHQIIGKTAFELYPKDLAVTYESAERKLIETGNNQKHEGQTIYADGSVRDVITYRTIYKDSNDNLGGTIGVLIDITDIKKSQKALNESRHQLLETQRIGKIGSWQWDSSANTIAISEVAASILGLKPEAQKIDADVFLAQLTSTDRTEFLYSLDEILGSGNMKTLNFEFELNTPTGIKRFCAIHAEPLSVQGKLQGSLQDISLQKETEMVLRESEGRYRNLVELAPLTIAVHTNGEITYINPAGIQLLHATSRADVIGRQISSIVHSLITDMPTTQADIYKELGNYPVHEEKLIRLDGTIIDVELVNMPIVYHGQHAVQVIAHDITERKKAEQLLIQSEQKLREINAAKDRFFSILAHDLRNPFNNIIGFTDLLKDGIDDFEDGEAAEILGLLNLTARNTYNLLENLLQWARTQTGKMEYMPQYVSVMTLFNETAGLFIVSSSNKGVLLEFGDSLDVEVVADPNMLKAILRNLVSNAIKFTPSGGKVTVSIEMIGNQVQFSIADTGVGITKADMEKLFRLDVSHTTLGTANEQGTGLGLVLCKEFVERNNGKIWIESVVGEGTVFYFTLPRGLAQ